MRDLLSSNCAQDRVRFFPIRKFLAIYVGACSTTVAGCAVVEALGHRACKEVQGRQTPVV